MQLHIPFIFFVLASYSSAFGNSAPLAREKAPIVAVAASFKPVLTKLLATYPKGKRWQIVSGSSGKITSQVLAGAKFALFLSADEVRPRLIQTKQGLPLDRLFRYGGGRLAFYQRTGKDRPLAEAIKACSAIAVANPRHAPFGAAGQTVLKRHHYNGKVVTGQNVAQVAQFLRTGAVPCGFLALSYRSAFPAGTISAVVGQPPIWQGGIVLDQSGEALRRFLLSPAAQTVIAAAGLVPAPIAMAKGDIKLKKAGQ